MKTEDIYNNIVGLLSEIQNDEKRLLAVLTFVENQILNQTNDPVINQTPPEYRNIVIQITAALNAGFVCFLNPETLQMEQLQCDTFYDVDEYADQNSDLIDEYAMTYIKWDNFIKFEPLYGRDLIPVMEDFIARMYDKDLANKLENALTGNRPIAGFCAVIDNSNQKENWREYKKQRVEDYVRRHLLSEIHEVVQ